MSAPVSRVSAPWATIAIASALGCGGPSNRVGPGSNAAGDGATPADASAIEASPLADSAVDSPATGDDGSAAHSPPIETLVNADTPGPGRSHGSPSIVAGGVGHVVLAAFDDTDEDIVDHAVGWSRSTDGVSFTDEGAFPDPSSPDGVVDVGYPCVGRDAIIGDVYVASVGGVTPAPLADGAARPIAYNALAFFVSANAGVSFAPALNAADPNLAPDDYTDFPSVAVDNAPGFAQGIAYVAYADFVAGGNPVKLRLSAYANHGFAVTEVVSPEPGDQASTPSVTVAPNHDVWIAYYSQVGGVPAIAAIRSADQGEHFDPPIAVAPLHLTVTPGSFNGDLGLQGQAPDGGAAAVDLYPSPQIAVNPVSGALYVAYVDATANDRANVYLVHSEDSGGAWSAPLQVNDDATTRDQFLPAMVVSLDGTRLAVGFDDRRDDAANRSENRYDAVATIAGADLAFEPNFRVSAVPSPVLVGADPYLKPTYFSVRTSLAADATYFYDAYADARSGNLDVHLARFGVAF